MVVGDQSVTAALVEFPAMQRHLEKFSVVTATGLARDAKKAGCDLRRWCCRWNRTLCPKVIKKKNTYGLIVY